MGSIRPRTHKESWMYRLLMMFPNSETRFQFIFGAWIVFKVCCFYHVVAALHYGKPFSHTHTHTEGHASAFLSPTGTMGRV